VNNHISGSTPRLTARRTTNIPVPSIENGTASIKAMLQLYPIEAFDTSASEELTASLQLGQARTWLTLKEPMRHASPMPKKNRLTLRFITATFSQARIPTIWLYLSPESDQSSIAESGATGTTWLTDDPRIES
jgi:hypothetical protein